MAFDIPEFIAPEFVSDSNPEDIQERMMNNLPADIDDMPGGFPYDMTMPTALEKSELIQFHLVRTLMLMFPMWSWGEWLDLHGKQCGVERREANKASGYVTFEGITGTRVSAGFFVCTPATEAGPSIEFTLDDEIIIPESGTVTVSVTAAEGGIGSNTKAETVTLMSKPIEGITRLYNEDDITGGTDEESNESYRERIMEKYESEGASFIGNDSDYKRWAKEVAGIGDCIVVPTWDGPGTVKLVLVDSNGRPANDQLVQAVYYHIISPNDREQRLMPTGSAELTVVAADTKLISYSCVNLVFDSSTNMEQITDDFKSEVMKYYVKAKEENIVKFNKVHAILTNLPGVLDFEEFKINGEDNNVSLEQDEYPETDEVMFE
jgi:uncharacterized phage protein gp47/JayE